MNRSTGRFGRQFGIAFVAATSIIAPLVLASCVGGTAPTNWSDQKADDHALSSIEAHPYQALCGEVRAGGMRCHAHMRTDIQNNASPQGFGPPDLQSAYKIPAGGGSGKIVAIVDAQDDPNAESDLAVYRSQYGLPPCTTANGCFTKLNQNGAASNYPSPDTGWAGEISLDLDMVSAACPDCKILLVEANSATTGDLGAAVNTAAAKGAAAISNSYGGPEDSTVVSASSSYYNHPGILVTASTGDNGYGTSFPASSQYVLAVGGTSLTASGSSRGWAEGAWSSGGSGCSAYIAKPSWQKDTGCSMRMVGDVSAVADPNTGVAVYVTYGASGWNVYGGTSASSPLVAAIFVATGKAGAGPSFPYSNTSDFYDVTSGSNGSCGGTYECTAGPGYDGPTGIGTPNSTAIASGGGGNDAGPVDSGAPDSGGGSLDAGPVDSGGGSLDAGPPNDAGGGGGGTCSHPICASGSSLTPGCDTCAGQVCSQDPYCCNTLWDNVCVSEVGSVCGQTCGGGGGDAGGGGSTCSHPICSAGGKLKSSCDTCANDVCSQDPYCCNTLWDNVCVSEVGSICGQTCP